MKAMQGHNVLHPMGFDAFGLPAENEAIKRGVHPAPMIERYAANYRRQMDLVGIAYDWSREFKSSDPSVTTSGRSGSSRSSTGAASRTASSRR